MDLVLPPGTPTYEMAAHNWTWPDNAWITHKALNLIISYPSLRPVQVDHLPIITVVDLPVARALPKPTPNFRTLNYNKFNQALWTCLDRESPACQINTVDEFQVKVTKLTTIIQETIELYTSPRKPSPFTKRWWNAELSELKKKKSCLSNEAHKYCNIANHPAKEEHKKVNQEYAQAIECVSKAHWINWLENISTQQIYTANKFVTGDPTDFSSAWIPSLKTTTEGAPFLASSNNDKATTLKPPPYLFLSSHCHWTTLSILITHLIPPHSLPWSSSLEDEYMKLHLVSNPSRHRAQMAYPTSSSPSQWTSSSTTSSTSSKQHLSSMSIMINGSSLPPLSSANQANQPTT